MYFDFTFFHPRSPVDEKPIESEVQETLQPIIKRHSLGTTTITASATDGQTNYGMLSRNSFLRQYANFQLDGPECIF